MIHLGTVQNLINYTFSSIKSKSLKKVAVDNDAVCNIKRTIVVWWAIILIFDISSDLWAHDRLGNRAFHNILSQKAQHYPKLLSLLRFELSRARYRQYNGRFRSLVREGDAGLAGIRF